MRNIMKKLSLEQLGRIWTEALYWYIRKEKERDERKFDC